MFEMVRYLPIKLSVTEDSLAAETGLKIKTLLWDWQIIYPTSHHDELPLYRRKENNFLLFF